MKKILALALAVAALGMTANAQLLYQWAFTNSTDTATNSSPTVAVTPGTGVLGVQNLGGNAVASGDIFFTTNVLYGPPGPNGAAGPFGALVCTNMTYYGTLNYAIATNGTLNLGNLFQFTITWWTQFQPFVDNDPGGQELARTVQFGAVAGYDSGGKGSGDHNGVGQALNGYTAANGYHQFQDGLANATLGNNPADTFTNADFPIGYNCDGQTWYFQAMTYNGLLTTTNFTQWISATNPVALTGTQLDSYVETITSGLSGPINFTTNAHAIFAGCTGADRNLTTGQLSDIRFYNGILTSNQLVQVMQFGYPTPASPPLAAYPATQPVSGKTYVGDSRTFSITAAGVPAVFTYTWRSNGVVIPTATGPSITVTNAQLSANGASFVCSVTNAAGGTNSTAGVITVVTPVGSYESAVLANNPYAFWHVNEASNAVAPIVISDYIQGNDGFAPDPANMLYTNGPQPGLYLGFPANETDIQTLTTGGASFLNMAVLPVFTNGAMTICGWVYTPTTGNATAGDNGLIFNLPSDTANGFGLVFGSGNELDYQWGNGNTTGSGLIIPTGEWTFVGLVVTTNLTAADIANSITADTNAILYIGAESLEAVNGTGFMSFTNNTSGTGSLNALTLTQPSQQILNGTSQAPLALGRSTVSGSDNGGNYARSAAGFNDVAVFYSALSDQAMSNLYFAGAEVLGLDGRPDVNNPGNLLLTYPQGVLYYSTNGVAGPYITVPNAASPYDAPISRTGSAFYRVQLF